jgi:hypothetical protein
MCLEVSRVSASGYACHGKAGSRSGAACAWQREGPRGMPDARRTWQSSLVPARREARRRQESRGWPGRAAHGRCRGATPPRQAQIQKMPTPLPSPPHHHPRAPLCRGITTAMSDPSSPDTPTASSRSSKLPASLAPLLAPLSTAAAVASRSSGSSADEERRAQPPPPLPPREGQASHAQGLAQQDVMMQVLAGMQDLQREVSLVCSGAGGAGRGESTRAASCRMGSACLVSCSRGVRGSSGCTYELSLPAQAALPSPPAALAHI